MAMARILGLCSAAVLATHMSAGAAADVDQSEACPLGRVGGVCAAPRDHWLLQVDRHGAVRRRQLACEGIPDVEGQMSRCAQPTTEAPTVGPPSTGPSADVHLSTFFWNVHWECSLAASGASRSCKERIGRRFVELAMASQAEIVASIELSDGNSVPASLSGFGLSGWQQVDGRCASGWNGDAAALAFAAGWKLLSSDGGCLRQDSDTRAFAVALVQPPAPVEGCPNLCVVAIHAPHSSINKGADVIRRVCGGAIERCVVAMGDWNTPAGGVAGLWQQLIGGAVPSQVHPDERTCCWPEESHYGIFDHLATNVAGARPGGYTVHPYQLLEERPMKQHRAVSASLVLPGAGSAVVVASV